MPFTQTPPGTPALTAEMDHQATTERAAGMDLHRQGDYAGALEHLARAEQMFRSLEDPVQLGWTLGHQGLVLEQLGRRAEALARLREAERILHDHEARAAFPLMLRRQADVLRRGGRSREALELYTSSEQLCRLHGDTPGLVYALSGHAAALLELGDPAGARLLLEECPALLVSTARKPSDQDFLLCARLVRVAMLTGTPAEAGVFRAQAQHLATLLRLHDDLSNADVISEWPHIHVPGH